MPLVHLTHKKESALLPAPFRMNSTEPSLIKPLICVLPGLAVIKPFRDTIELGPQRVDMIFFG
jgi:hypothetical protein